MLSAEIISVLEAEFGARIKDKKPDAMDPYVVVEPDNLVDICRYLRDDPQLRFEMLNNISGVDYLEIDPKKIAKAGYEPHIELVYHLQSISHCHRFTLKVILPRWKEGQAGQLPEVPTLCEIWQSADWHEREVYDLIGIWFVGHPDPRRILCSEDWVGHPLRKDYEFPLEYHGIRGR